jgi:DNA-binding LytR/AlgR family response regulator
MLNYFRFTAITFAIGVFPITFGVIRKHNAFKKLNEETASKINRLLDQQPVVAISVSEEKKLVVLLAENEKDSFTAEPHELLYCEAADNYTEIAYLEAGSLKKVLLRGSLRRMEQQLLPFPYLVRCHRAFLVNLENVTHIEGNAAGYKLSMRNCTRQVPVSRNFGQAITDKLKHIRQKA